MENQAKILRNDNVVNDTSKPLRPDDKKGRILIAAKYEDMQISMKRIRGLTELIVNGNVYAEIEGVLEFEYTLTANINGKMISGMCKMTTSCMYLYVDSILIKKKLRLY